MKHRRLCFWCGLPSPTMTRDHVVPICAGGKDEANIVDACADCNQARGLFASAYGYWKSLLFRLDRFASTPSRSTRKHRRQICRRRNTLANMVASLQPALIRWSDIERRLLGRAVSAVLMEQIVIPPLPWEKLAAIARNKPAP